MNLDSLKETLQKIPIGVLGVVAALYFGYDLYTFKTDPESPLLQKQSERQQLQDSNSKLQVKLTQAREFFKTLDQKRTEIRAMAEQLREMKAILTEELEVPGFIKLVVTEARKVGLTVLSIKPTELKKQPYYDEQSFDFNFRGVYVQLLVFLDRLSSIERIVRVDNFDIKSTRSVGPYIELDGKVQIRSYRYVRSKEDELALAGGSTSVQAVVPGAKPPGAPAQAAPPAQGGSH
jgi:Tfp pilus assembly protein PilO